MAERTHRTCKCVEMDLVKTGLNQSLLYCLELIVYSFINFCRMAGYCWLIERLSTDIIIIISNVYPFYLNCDCENMHTIHIIIIHFYERNERATKQKP